MHKPMLTGRRTTVWNAWRSRPSHQVQYLVTTGMVYLVLKTGSQNWWLRNPYESENHVKVGAVSIWDVKEALRATSTVTTLSVSIARSAW